MTTGQGIYASISPFLYSQHSVPREEMQKIVADAIDRELEKRDDILKRLIALDIRANHEQNTHKINALISAARDIYK